jgi:alpha-galactosidase
MNRRRFLHASGAVLGTCLPALDRVSQAASAMQSEARQESTSFEWSTEFLEFSFLLSRDRLRQGSCVPVGVPFALNGSKSYGVEVALQCTGENSPDPGMKSAMGMPGVRLQFGGKEEKSTSNGRRLSLVHTDSKLSLHVESIYEAFHKTPMVRRRTRVTNNGNAPVGIDFLSSAMLHGLADPKHYDHELRIHIPFNSWMAEGQWRTFKPSELGFVENERTSWSEASAASVGSWSTEKFLPMAMVENTVLGLIWFWQIEHDGSWYWEVSNVSHHSNYADDVYAYLGGPDDLHSAAWKNLQPGQSYESVPVAIGCVKGGFSDAVEALTVYRRSACKRSRRNGDQCPVIFNDYMNCLFGDPTEAKELPLIHAAASAGCDYYVIDCGWYAPEGWGDTFGAWEPSKTRWPHGLKYVFDKIRNAGMVPGLWLEPEVAGPRSVLESKPDDWFFMRHGKRVLRASRYLLDFRNPEVRSYIDGIIARVVEDYGVGYIKMDYNVDSLLGTDLHSDSAGQGLLENNRAYLAWIDRILNRYPDLILENCGSGGSRMDYAQLSYFQIQSLTDQEDYLRMPAILTGSSAGVLPEQAAIWTYPTAESNPDKASFNMVTGMVCRMHQSGRLDQLSNEAFQQVRRGIEVYKNQVRKHVPKAVPFYPLGMPNVTNNNSPVALGMRAPELTWLAVWRLDGPSRVKIPIVLKQPQIVFPTDLGISAEQEDNQLTIEFPRIRMGCLMTT